ncbi:hypothetical protein [Leucobacter salsicius]|uniref:hypothetical protein n=1 Tax=Leucobacter salsicius TaxID=664638 RepID=UPI0012F8374C|nr:hypothetical protein [Leucobacter salsicius]
MTIESTKITTSISEAIHCHARRLATVILPTEPLSEAAEILADAMAVHVIEDHDMSTGTSQRTTVYDLITREATEIASTRDPSEHMLVREWCSERLAELWDDYLPPSA